MTPTPKDNRMEGGLENRDRAIEPHDSKARLSSISPRTWKFCKYTVHATFKIEPFLALSRSVKLKFPSKKSLKTEFYPSKKGVIYINISKRRMTFETTHPYKFVKMLKFLYYKFQLII